MKAKVENIYVEFPGRNGDGSKEVLRGINFAIHEGEIVSILGKSGCGKTTLLNVIGGLLTPMRGAVHFYQNGQIRTPKTGYVFQSFSLFPWMDVASNIRIGFQKGKEDKRELERVMNLVGLSEAAGEIPGNLSGGMAQRAALARALVSRPDIMLLDEPFSSLDAFTKMRLQEEVWTILKDEGITTVLVTHDIDESIYFGDRVMIMSDGGTIKSEMNVELTSLRDRNSKEFFCMREGIYREYGLSATKPFFYQI